MNCLKTFIFAAVSLWAVGAFSSAAAPSSSVPSEANQTKPGGGFELQTLDRLMGNPWLKTVGDLDGDGRTDIVVGGAKSGGLVAYLNRFPKWDRQVLDAERRFSTDGEVLDVDGDGHNDLVVITLNPSTVSWYRQTRSGWARQVLIHQTWHDLEVDDFDGDGRADIVGRNQREWPAKDDAGNRLHFLWQKRDGNKSSWEESSLDCPAGEGLLAVDLDRDGDRDIIINGRWYENLGGRRWQEHPFARPEDWAHPNSFIAGADFNNDGRLDLVLSPSELKGGRYRMMWFEAPANPRQDGWRAHAVVPDVESVCHFVGAADFDGDGGADIAYAQMPQGTDPDNVRILFNRGRRNGVEWSDAWQPLTLSESGSHSMRILDADGDGHPDLVGANWSAEGQDEQVKLWFNRLHTGKAPMAVSEVDHQGQESFKIATSSATYIFHKRGAGFASLLDTDGKDWISYRPGGGSAGEYRGIPNCGQCFHPGYTNATSRLTRTEANHVTIESETLDHGYRCQWDILPDHAIFTLLKAETNYWFLYEGTPGGKLDEANQFLVKSTGEKAPLSQVWSQDIPAPEWLYFADPGSQRSLLLIHHEDDDIVDQYWPMQGNMTVFGFGRKYKTIDRHLMRVPARFTIALVDSIEFQKVCEMAGLLLRSN